MTIRQWFSALCIILSLATSANAFDETDYRRLDKLWDKFLQLERDLANFQHGIAQGSSPTRSDLIECLDDLSGHLERAERSIGFVTTLGSLATLMVNKFDERRVLDVLSVEARYFNKYVDLGRKYIDKMTDFCPSSRAVAIKAQEVVGLFDEASPVVRSISGQSNP
jgi:hypothetical protein